MTINIEKYTGKELEDFKKKVYTAINQFIEDRGLENIPDQCSPDWCNKHYDCTANICRNSEYNSIYITERGLYNILTDYDKNLLDPFFNVEDNIDAIKKALNVKYKIISINHNTTLELFIEFYLPKIKKELDTSNDDTIASWGDDIVSVIKTCDSIKTAIINDEANKILRDHPGYKCIDAYCKTTYANECCKPYIVYIFKKML